MVSEFDLEEMERLSASYVPDQKVSPTLTQFPLLMFHRDRCSVHCYRVKLLQRSMPKRIQYLPARQRSIRPVPKSFSGIFTHGVQTLPEQYPYYRTVRGDGNCGWRGRVQPKLGTPVKKLTMDSYVLRLR